MTGVGPGLCPGPPLVGRPCGALRAIGFEPISLIPKTRILTIELRLKGGPGGGPAVGRARPGTEIAKISRLLRPPGTGPWVPVGVPVIGCVITTRVGP